MKPERILYVCGGIMNRGGIESYMMNYYRHINREEIQIDFIVHGNQKGVYDDEIIKLGGYIYRVPVKSKDYFGNVRELKKIFNSGKYKILHTHMDAMNMVVLKIAKQCGIPFRISHSHNTQHLTSNPIKFILNEYARKNVKKYATHLFACSELAAEWLYGKQSIKNGNVTIINNAIDFSKYLFSERKRVEMRNNMRISENEIVIGHIGRFDYQKNHIFLLKIFKKYLETNPDSRLILIGEGHLKPKIIELIDEMQISENVLVVGSTDKVEDYLNMFDIFVFPSLFEGLGIVLIEAQVSGLQCITSDQVPKEANITGNVSYLSLDESEKTWSNQIENIIKNYGNNRNIDLLSPNLISYDIESEAKNLQVIYQEILRSK